MSCRTKAKLWLVIYWANTVLLLFSMIRFILTETAGLGVTTPMTGAAVGVLVSMAVTRYWQQASIVPPPADTHADASQQMTGDHTLMLEGRPIAVVRRGQQPDGSTVWYRSTPPPGFLTPWQRPHPEARLLRPRAASYYNRTTALAEAEEAIRLRQPKA